MNKLLILLFAFTLWLSGCSKKDTSDKVPPKQNDNTTQYKKQDTTELNTTPTNTTQQNTTTSNSSSFYNVTNVSDAKNGKELVDFTWSENGKDKMLSEYKGKVIFLNFWATWCPPCRKELPDLSAIASELKDKNFTMLGISVDENSAALTDFLSANKLSYTVLLDQSNIVAKYMKITSQPDNVIPQSYIIDKNGKVVEAVVGSRSKQEFLKLINKYM